MKKIGLLVLVIVLFLILACQSSTQFAQSVQGTVAAGSVAQIGHVGGTPVFRQSATSSWKDIDGNIVNGKIEPGPVRQKLARSTTILGIEVEIMDRTKLTVPKGKKIGEDIVISPGGWTADAEAWMVESGTNVIVIVKVGIGTGNSPQSSFTIVESYWYPK